MTPLKPSALDKTMKLCYLQRKPLFIEGSPGIGKTEKVKQFCREFKVDGKPLEIIDLRLSYYGIEELKGLPNFKGDFTKWFPPDFFPRSGNGILFLDELSNAPMAVQGIALQLTLDRKLTSSYTLPDGWVVFAAGNKQSDRSLANRMPSALVNRFLKVELEPDIESFYNYGMLNDMSLMVLSYIRKFKPQHLYTFDPSKSKGNDPFASPRSWESVSNFLKEDASAVLDLSTGIAQGLIGEGVASEFVAYHKYYKKIPSLDSIIEKPKTAPIPDEPHLQYAVVSGLARKAEPKNIDNILTYADRLDKELAACLMKDVLLLHKNTLYLNERVSKWFVDNHKYLKP